MNNRGKSVFLAIGFSLHLHMLCSQEQQQASASDHITPCCSRAILEKEIFPEEVIAQLNRNAYSVGCGSDACWNIPLGNHHFIAFTGDKGHFICNDKHYILDARQIAALRKQINSLYQHNNKITL